MMLNEPRDIPSWYGTWLSVETASPLNRQTLGRSNPVLKEKQMIVADGALLKAQTVCLRVICIISYVLVHKF
jgi:hypothetical protein